MKLVLLTLAASAASVAAQGVTCGALKEWYRKEECCGLPAKAVKTNPTCPYDFTKPNCSVAEPQSPRDLTANAQGDMVPKAATLTKAQAAMLPLANVHFHLGAEHKSESYADDADANAYDAASSNNRRLADKPRPGFMCASKDLTSDQKKTYDFQYCVNTEVGKSYEVHYVHSSAGGDQISEGLGQAAHGRGQLNPMVAVTGVVYQIVNGAPDLDVYAMGGMDAADSVMYSGSTTGQSHNNEICSPYTITWHVDKKCRLVSPKAFDDFCKKKKDAGLKKDLYPHGSRIILDPKWVVKSDYVKPLV